MTEPRPFWALLVGVDQFLAQPDLGGCANDIAAMRSLLVDGFAVPTANVRVLRDAEATRQGILDAFSSHLIENDAINRGDQILFHFSGHGANMLDPQKASPTGLIESLVAHDSGTEGVFNIPDTTVAALLELLAAKRGDNITVVLDCCHSGSGTRQGGERAPRVRLTETDERVPPADLDAGIVAAARALGVGKRWREEGVPYTLLAACRDRELAQEYIDYQEDDQPAYGAFTWHLTDALWKLTPDTSYAILHESVASRVNAYNPYQMPQCEGNVDRSVFGSRPVRRDPFIKVIGVERGELILGGGRVHGIGKGAIVELYPKTVQTLEDLPDTALATAQVTSVGASRSRAYASIADVDSLVLARAVVVEPGEVAPRRAVALEADDMASAAAKRGLDDLRQMLERAALVRLADGDDRAEFVVRAEGEALVIRGNDEPQPLVEPASIGVDARAALTALEAITRFRRVAALRNDEPGSRLQGQLRLQMRRFIEGARPRDMPLVEVRDGEVVLTFDPEAEENLYLVEVINDSPADVFVSVLMLNADYSVGLLYPSSGGEQAVAPGHSLFVGHNSPDDLLDVWLPGDEPGETLWTISHNQLKAVATLQPTDLSLLLQHGLDVPPPSGGHRGDGLEALISQSVSGHRMGRRRKKASEDWAAADRSFTVIRKPDGVRVEAGRSALGDGITLHAPDGFRGQAELGTMGQASRGAGGLRAAVGLRMADGFEPLGLMGTRGADAGVVLSLTVDEAQRARISADNPLRLERRGAEDLWPVAFDGQDHLLVGRPDAHGGSLITSLPAPAGPGQRGAISRTVELFFYKKRGMPQPTLGLHTVSMVDGQPVYADTRPEDVPRGGRALLVVHGFGSGTLGQIRALAPALASLGYDTLLTYDYESFGTPLTESGGDLAEALRGAGFGPDDGRRLDVVAHSMGGLVCRAMIELFGGAAYVDRLAMAGSPNGGTRLMKALDGLYTVANVGINKVLGPAVGGVVSWLLAAVKKQALGPGDLRPDSAFLERLNRSSGGRVPYLALAGQGGVSAEDRGLLTRLASKGVGVALDLVFGQPHDLIVGEGDVFGIRGGAYPALTTHRSDCNHFDYLVDEGSVSVIRSFLGGGSEGQGR